MMRNISELKLEWSGPPLRQEDVKTFEAHFDLTLPSDYLNFLSLVNGGVPRTNIYFYIDERQEQGIVSVGALFPLVNNREEFGGIWWETQRLRDILTEMDRDINVAVIARDGSINPIYLDMSDTPPTVHILYLDDEPLDSKIAVSFEQFIDGLSP